MFMSAGPGGPAITTRQALLVTRRHYCWSPRPSNPQLVPTRAMLMWARCAVPTPTQPPPEPLPRAPRSR